MTPVELTQTQLTHQAQDLMAAKMYSLACCVMAFYDIMITLGTEVERIWMRKFGLINVLYLMNRYISPLGFIVVTVSFNDPWRKSVCDRYVLFPEALKVVTTVAIGVIFILRLHAIYGRSYTVVAVGGALLLLELGLKIWAFTDGTVLPLPTGLIGCILVGKHNSRFVFTWVAELIFDSMVFFMTLWRCIVLNRLRRGNTDSLVNLILRDGVMYFGVIFVVNLANVLTFVLATADIQAINASFSTLITSVMVSRLILNLRGAGQPENPPPSVGRYHFRTPNSGSRIQLATEHHACLELPPQVHHRSKDSFSYMP